MTTLQFFVALGVGLLAGGCKSGEQAPGDTQPPRPSTAAPAPSQAPPAHPLEPVVHVPIGEFTSGSRPREPGRNPALEPTESRIKLGPFRIDRSVYSSGKSGSKGASSPLLVAEQKEAEARCAERSGRLCTELEWERACRGPASSPYPGGDQACSDDCPSGFDVSGMGMQPEWTASVFGKDSTQAGEPVVRGAPLNATPEERRCARRLSRKADALTEGLAFRCCYGAPNAVRVREPKEEAVFEETDIELGELAKLLASDPHTTQLTEELGFYKEDAAATVLARGPGETMGFSLTTRAVRWSPARGVQLLVVSGYSGKKTAFVVAYYQGSNPPKLAGSFIMKNERGPIALAYAPSIRPRMHFSGCWGCPGETGKLLYRPEEGIVLLQP